MREPFRLDAVPIERQVILALVALVVPLVAASFWAASRVLSDRRSELTAETTSIASMAASDVDQLLRNVDLSAAALAAAPDVRARRQSACADLAARMINDDRPFRSVVLVEHNGATVCSTVPPGDRVVQPALVRAATRVFARGRASNAELDAPSTDVAAIVAGYPVVGDDGAVVAALGVAVDVGRLQSLVARISLPAGSVVTVADATSRIVARSLDPDKFIGTTIDATPTVPSRVPRSVVRTGVDGVARVFANASIDRGPWVLSVGIPTAIATERAKATWRRSLAIAFVWTLASTLIGLTFARRLIRPSIHLKKVATRIASGDFSPPERINPPALEFAELQDAFGTMAASLRGMRDTLDRQLEQERKMREAVQSLQRKVVRQERLAAVGLLVSGVAHELNNPLQAILGTAELLERTGDLDAEALEEVGFVKTQSGRAREIIRNLSRFSSQQPGPPTQLNLREVVDEVVQLRQLALETSSIALGAQVETNRQVFANFTEIEQVILNFVINAEQALVASPHPGGRILIRVSDSGRKVRVDVQDDGPGVQPEDEPKLFQPFFTTKPVGQGTGLGLSVSYGIIDSYSGAIGYHPNEWGGSTFFFELPAVEAGAPAPGAATATHP